MVTTHINTGHNLTVIYNLIQALSFLLTPLRDVVVVGFTETFPDCRFYL